MPVTRNSSDIPSRTLAGVTVIDTPLVRAAQSLAREHSSDFTYRHIMRCWLYGALIIEHDETYRDTIDLELHAVAVILHDIGWDQTPGSIYISSDKRFEIDSAMAARNFVRAHGDESQWDERRVQLLWDTVALHTETSIGFYKETVVKVMSSGVIMDFGGPAYGVTPDEYAAVNREFPKADLEEGVNDTITWLCRTKPSTTYDNWMQTWGEKFVEGYDPKGKQFYDGLFANRAAAGF